MSERREHRYEATFTASEALDGRPIIALVLDQEGQAAAGQDQVFFLELDHGVDPEATSRIAAFLGQYIKGFGVMTRIPQVTHDPTEPDSENGTSVLRRDEPGTSPKEEGQPTSPPQIDDVREVEGEEPHSQGGEAVGPIRVEER
jgi:hypothetical protein